LVALLPLLALCLAIPAQSDPIAYTITFTATYGSGPKPTAGSFDYDSTLETFSDFDVVLDGTTFDMTAEANDPAENNLYAIQGDPPCIGSLTGAESTFIVMTDCSAALWNFVTEGVGPGAFEFYDYGTEGTWIIATDPNCSNNCLANNGGQFVVSAAQVATPEPGTITLMLGGLGGWLIRKRKAHRPPPPKIC
jgi:hypothetical protein